MLNKAIKNKYFKEVVIKLNLEIWEIIKLNFIQSQIQDYHSIYLKPKHILMTQTIEKIIDKK